MGVPFVLRDSAKPQETERELPLGDGTELTTARVTRVAEGFLETIGAPLLRGRSITAEDRAAGARVAVISEPLARRLFPNGDALGERLKFSLEENREQEFTIMGVSADFATAQLTTPRSQMLLPLPEKPASSVFLIARGAARDEKRLTSAFEKVVREFDPELVRNVGQWVDAYFDRPLIDATGLQGGWNFSLYWTPRGALPNAPVRTVQRRSGRPLRSEHREQWARGR